jgi:hypothetical protein
VFGEMGGKLFHRCVQLVVFVRLWVGGVFICSDPYDESSLEPKWLSFIRGLMFLSHVEILTLNCDILSRVMGVVRIPCLGIRIVFVVSVC